MGFPEPSPNATSAAPYVVGIDVLKESVLNVNWSSFTFNAGTYWYGGLYASSGAQNDEIDFDVLVAAGTWTFDFVVAKSNNLGIITVYLDGVPIGTLDQYAASFAANQVVSLTGIVVATTGVKRLKLKMETKNASSSGYTGGVQHVTLRRTGN